MMLCDDCQFDRLLPIPFRESTSGAIVCKQSTHRERQEAYKTGGVETECVTSRVQLCTVLYLRHFSDCHESCNGRDRLVGGNMEGSPLLKTRNKIGRGRSILQYGI